MKKIFNKIIYFIFLALPATSLAQGILEPGATAPISSQVEAFRGNAGYAPGKSLGYFMAIVIQAFLGLLGIIFVILIIYAGYNWMTAAGEEQKVEKAQNTIRRAIIGLIIIVGAYAITYFVFNYLGEAGGGGSLPP